MTRRALFAAAMAAALPKLAEAKSMPSFRAHIETIQHKCQRYSTCGDWQVQEWDRRINLRILVSEMPDWRYMALVAIHEAIEAILCRHRGISEEEVTAWDRHFEGARAHDRGVMIRRLDELKTRTGPAPADEHEEADIEADLAANDLVEPGDHPNCPYRAEHVFASKIERMLAGELDIEWGAYERAIEAL